MPRSPKGVILALLAFAMVASVFAVVPAQADTKSFTLFGSASGGWGSTATSLANPGPTITVTQGDTVALTLNSQDLVPHNWFIDFNNNNGVDTGEPSSNDFSGSTAGSFSFTADRVGTFTYKCKYHPTTMTGQIVIKTPPTFELFGDLNRGWGETNTTAGITSPGPTLTVKQGDSVTIELKAVDGQSHSWFIDYNNNSVQDTNEPHSDDFSSSVRFTFTANQAGTYTYRCRFHPSVMSGTIKINATGGTTTSDNTVLVIGGVIIVVAIVAVAAAVMMRRKPKA